MKRYSIFSAPLLLSFLLLSHFSNVVYGNDVTDLISKSEASGAKAANKASGLIDGFREYAAQQSGSAGNIVDSLNNEDKSGNGHGVTQNQGLTPSNSKLLPSASVSKYPKQEALKDIPLVHEGKKKCKGAVDQNSGKCPSSLFEGMEAKQSLNSSSGAHLLIFVSQSVPPDSIKELSAQANRVGGKLVFRGLVGESFKETQNYIQELGVVADIDPTKFEEFEVTQVPAFVLSREGKHDKMVGNISLGGFLEQSSSNGDLRQEAAELYKKLQGGQS